MRNGMIYYPRKHETLIICCSNVGQCRRRRANIKITFVQRLVFAGISLSQPRYQEITRRDNNNINVGEMGKDGNPDLTGK